MWPAERLIDMLYRATGAEAVQASTGAEAVQALQELQTETHKIARSKNVLDTFTPINEIVTALTETCEDCVEEIARRMQLIKSEYENYTVNESKSYLIGELFRVVCGLIVALPSPNRNIREPLEALAIYGKKPTTKTAIRLLEYARQITPSMDTYWVAQAHFPPAKGASVEVNVTPQRWEKRESMPSYKTDGWHSATVSRVDDRTVELTFLDDSEHGSTRENFQIGDFAPNKLVEVKMKEIMFEMRIICLG